jgi:nascent polypeptide-associated complex subunit beta
MCGFLIVCAPQQPNMPFNAEKLKKLQEKSKSVQTGGKGTVRRKHKTVRKNAVHDDKKLKNTLNRLNVRDIPAIEEVNLFKDDGTVIHFAAPKGACARPAAPRALEGK